MLLDRNESMLSGRLYQALIECNLREAITSKHGQPRAPTVINNETDCPIGGIWCSRDIETLRGGYLPFTALAPRTNHRTLWIELSFTTAFGHNMPDIIRPKMRHLQCSDPRSVDNYIRKYKKSILDQDLLQRVRQLESIATYPVSSNAQEIYEELDELRCRAVAAEERSCRKLKAGQVAFSPTIKGLMSQIRAWSLLKRKAEGHKVSSRLLERCLRKAQLGPEEKIMSIDYLESKLKETYKIYYSTKGNAALLRSNFLHTLAEAWEDKQNKPKEQIYRQLLRVENKEVQQDK